MNYTQNEKLAQVSESTLVVGIDIGSETHYARAFDWCGVEYSKKPIKFANTAEGFRDFEVWIFNIKESHGKTEVITGLEPTGHYWFNLGKYLQEIGINVVTVNPHHVKKSKELDDNSPTKNDRKDPKIIAGLVKDGRYSYVYIPEGIYAELRTASNLRFRLTKELASVKNRIHRWLTIYFPEYKQVYGNVDSVSGQMILKQAPMPEDIVTLGAEGINQIWRDAKVRAVGMKRATTLVEAAKRSIGSKDGGESARMEILILLDDLESKSKRLDDLMILIEELCMQVPMVDKLLKIKGVGLKTVSGFIAEVGDIRRFDDPKQLQKLAGLALKENSSGQHKGKTTISKRGRKRLRYLLFEVAMSLVGKNPEFKEIHEYYTTRAENPLKKMQSLMAIACKLIRVFYAILTKGTDYNADKMLRDIKRPEQLKPVA